MEHGVDDDLRRSDFEEDGVRKPTQQSATHRRIDELIGFRMDAIAVLNATRNSRARRRLWA